MGRWNKVNDKYKSLVFKAEKGDGNVLVAIASHILEIVELAELELVLAPIVALRISAIFLGV
jgi:hypothetical protein